MQAVRAVVESVGPDVLDAYARATGLVCTPTAIPLTYLGVEALRLTAAATAASIESDDNVIHLTQRMSATRAIGRSEALQSVLQLRERSLPQGPVLDVKVVYIAESDEVAVVESRFLVRKRTDRRSSVTRAVPPGLYDHTTVIRIDGDMPRRYASVAGDHNPIHLDDATAQAAGFPGPILHGLCTLALCVHAMGRTELLQSVEARFVDAVVPPASIELDSHTLGASSAKFRARTADRVVLDRGMISWRES